MFSIKKHCRVKVQNLNYNLIKGYSRDIKNIFQFRKNHFQLVSCRSESSNISMVVLKNFDSKKFLIKRKKNANCLILSPSTKIRT